MTLQGFSQITPIKEVQIGGTVQMRLTQRKHQHWISAIRVYDVFSGDGVNILEGESIDGSPVEIANAIIGADVDCELWASDINPVACERLGVTLQGYPFCHVEPQRAEEQLRRAAGWLAGNRTRHAVIVIDPNGPGVLPWDAMMLIAEKYAKQADIIFNISETAMRRVMACSLTKCCNWWAEYQTFTDALAHILRNYRAGWVRQALNGDRQKWRLLCMWSFAPPKRAWEAQGLIEVRSRADIETAINGDRNEDAGNTSSGKLAASDDLFGI